MFYETADNKHGLPHDPFKALAVPRPIGWIASMGPDGRCDPIGSCVRARYDRTSFEDAKHESR